jgi:hypothetical protein
MVQLQMNYIKICEIPEKVLLDQFEIEYSDFCIHCDRSQNKATKDYDEMSAEEFGAKYQFCIMVVGSGMQQPTLGIYVGDEPFGWFNYADETWEYL